MSDDKPITYAGPTGRERPGEHWNARILREQAAAGVNVCRFAPTPGICDQHGVDYGECADEHPPEVSS